MLVYRVLSIIWFNKIDVKKNWYCGYFFNNYIEFNFLKF